MMNMVTWNPFREMEELIGRYQRNLGRSLMPVGSDGDVPVTNWSPVVDITENDKEYVVKAELPGVKKDDVKVTVQNGVLTVEGERKVEHEEKKERYHRIERFYGSFSRSFGLPEDVSADKVSADSKEGVIYIHLPKSAQKKPQSVEIKVN